MVFDLASGLARSAGQERFRGFIAPTAALRHGVTHRLRPVLESTRPQDEGIEPLLCPYLVGGGVVWDAQDLFGSRCIGHRRFMSTDVREVGCSRDISFLSGSPNLWRQLRH